MTGLLLDFRFAVRSLVRSKWFTLLAVLILALGISLNTALFSLVDAVLLRALPFAEPDRLVEIWGEDTERSGMRVPAPLLEAIRMRSTTLEQVGIHSPAGFALRTVDGLVDVRGDRVSANFTALMGVRPVMGRGFLPHEDAAGAAPVLLVSHAFWQRYLNGDRGAIGRPLTLDSMVFTVIGVMPPEFTMFRGGATEFWTTYVEGTRELERESGYELIGRLAPEVSLAQARGELAAISAGVAVPEWQSNNRRLGMVPLEEEIVRDSARGLKLMLAAVALVLAIVSANLALLLLARSDRRVGEFATRKALGASPRELLRLALVENILLAALGGAAGIALAFMLLPLMLRLAPAGIPRIAEATIDGRVLVFAVVLMLVTGAAFGCAPALRLLRVSVLDAAKPMGGRFSSQHAWLRSVLVSSQVAASVALCVLAGLVGRTFLTLQPSDPGFDPRSLNVYTVYLSPRLYPTAEERIRRQSDLVSRVEAIPGVAAVATASNIPFSTDETATRVVDLANPDRADTLRADLREITTNYFELLRIPLVRGRAFNASDVGSAPGVVVVNQSFARKIAANGDVVGRSVRIGRSERVYQIVGVSADARSTGTSVDILHEIYVPYTQRGAGFVYLIMRSNLDTRALTSAVRREIRTVAPELALAEDRTTRSLDEIVQRSLAGPRFTATLSSAFSTTALLLAAIGVFGLVAYSVAQKRHELGIRLALGARPFELAFSATRSAILWTLSGIAIGLAAAAYLTRFVAAQLYAIEPLDITTFAGGALLTLLAAAIAAFVPARRAARADPMASLRSHG